MHLPEHIHYRYASLSEAPLDVARKILSETERRYLDTLQLEKRRREFVAGRWVARHLASSLMGGDPRDVPLIVRGDGSLELNGRCWNVSLAHSRTGVVAGMARHVSIGVDLEEIKPRNPDLIRFILHEAEYNVLEALPLDRDRSLILMWTLKEAVLKGMRTGFRCSPRTLRVTVNYPCGEATIHAPDSTVWTARFEECAGNYLSIAYC